MIRLKKQGKYQLGETKSGVKLLHLDDKQYIWLNIPSIGDVLSLPSLPHVTTAVFSEGVYRLYDVKDESDLVDLRHLELEIDSNQWQSYLLLTGLPRGRKRRSRIIPTNEKVAEYITNHDELEHLTVQGG